MKKVVIFIFLICCVLYSVYKMPKLNTAVITAVFPTFPTLKKPAQKLDRQQSGTIYFQSSTPFDLDVIFNDANSGLPTTTVGKLFLPEKASAKTPVPAMVILHGSGGISPGREMKYAQLLKNNGYAAFIINYNAPRGVTNKTPFLMRLISVTEFDAMVDAYAGLKILSTHPAIKSQKIGLIGFSYGGVATRFAMDERFRKKLTPKLPGFAAFVDYYGPCFQNIGTQNTNGKPLLTLRGTEDSSNDLAACKLREIELSNLGVKVETHIFEDAGHAWDIQSPQRLRRESMYISNCEINYNSQGYPSVDGKLIFKPTSDMTRARRITMRIVNLLKIVQCVNFGYIVGNNKITRTESDKRLISFLNRHLK